MRSFCMGCWKEWPGSNHKAGSASALWGPGLPIGSSPSEVVHATLNGGESASESWGAGSRAVSPLLLLVSPNSQHPNNTIEQLSLIEENQNAWTSVNRAHKSARCSSHRPVRCSGGVRQLQWHSLGATALATLWLNCFVFTPYPIPPEPWLQILSPPPSASASAGT